MRSDHRPIELPFPLGQYIQQLLFSPLSITIWSPMKFWCFYRLQILEQCYDLDYIKHTHYIQYLEQCWKNDVLFPPQTMNDPKENHNSKDNWDNQGQKQIEQ